MIFPEIFSEYQDVKNPENSDVFAGFFGSPENFSQKITGKKRDELFQKFLEEQGIQNSVEKICDPFQTHSKILFSDENFLENSDCDGVFTEKKNVLCVVKTADCIGAIFYNPQLKIGATIHAGWRGLAQKIFSEFLQKFSVSDRENFLVALSPSLGKCCAEFSDPYAETPEFFHDFIEKRTENRGEKIKTSYYVDFWKIAKIELLQNGVPEKNIQMPEFCTKCGCDIFGKKYPQKFWSHRNGEAQRNGTFFLRK